FGSSSGAFGVTWPSFSIGHVYPNPGSFTLTVTVNDNYSNAGPGAQAQVNVQSPLQAAQTLSNLVTNLGTSGVLSQGEVNALTGILGATMHQHAGLLLDDAPAVDVIT